MAIMSTGTETSIKPFKHVANMSMNTNISLEHVYDARIIVIRFGKRNKPRECYVMILGLWKLANDWRMFWRCPGSDWKPCNALNCPLG